MAVINFKTLLSAFNEKGTLLKWLQKLETALTKSVLTDITVTTSAGAAVFSFNFADGTKLETPPVTLPQGEPGTPGADGRGIASIEAGASYVAGDETVTPLTITFTAGLPTYLSVKAKNGTNGTDGTDGAPGADGRGIASIFTIGHRTEGDEEITTLEIAYDEGEPEQIEVHAQNGTDGQNGADGNGIITVHALRHYQQGNETVTVIEVVTDDNTNPQFEVHAQNGTDGGAPLKYRHILKLGVREDNDDYSTIFLVLENAEEIAYTTSNEIIGAISNYAGGGTIPCSGITDDRADNYIVGLYIENNSLNGVYQYGGGTIATIEEITDTVKQV